MSSSAAIQGSSRLVWLNRIGSFVALILFLVPSCCAQNLPSPNPSDQMGLQTYGSYHGGDIDSIGLSSGTLTVHAPFLSYPQRGKLQLSFDIFYNNEPQHIGEKCVQGPRQTNPAVLSVGELRLSQRRYLQKRGTPLSAGHSNWR